MLFVCKTWLVVIFVFLFSNTHNKKKFHNNKLKTFPPNVATSWLTSRAWRHRSVNGGRGRRSGPFSCASVPIEIMKMAGDRILELASFIPRPDQIQFAGRRDDCDRLVDLPQIHASAGWNVPLVPVGRRLQSAHRRHNKQTDQQINKKNKKKIKKIKKAVNILWVSLVKHRRNFARREVSHIAIDAATN